MADFSALKTAIQANIRTNGNEEITGAILQDILLSMVTTMGDGAINDLAEALLAEITNRQNAVSGEATTRAEADSQLSGRINAEAQTRSEADTQLGNSITAIITRLNEGYVYAGIAIPSTNPGTPAGKVFYIALQAGTYTNFSSLDVTKGINILKYNGTAWSQDNLLAIDNVPKKNGINMVTSGGIFANIGAFDISEYHKSDSTLATYADLTAALAALPSDFQKGGMSIKFVQSSDNKYVQYRLMAQNFTTDTTQWQGVDDEPTAGSDNLVKSGGVYGLILEIIGIGATAAAVGATEGDYFFSTQFHQIRQYTNGTTIPIITPDNAIFILKDKFYKIVGQDIVQISSDGVFNVTTSVPLGSGYYTIDTAIAAIPDKFRRGGMLITFRTANVNWEMYQYILASADSNFTNPLRWVKIASTYYSAQNNPCVNVNILANHLETKYTLSSAIAAIPTEARLGGMSIYYRSGDVSYSKAIYVRYDVSDTYFLNEDNWDKTDIKLSVLINGENEYFYINKQINKTNGAENAPVSPSYHCTTFLPVQEGLEIYSIEGGNDGASRCSFYDKNLNFISSIIGGATSGVNQLTILSSQNIPANAVFFRATGNSQSKISGYQLPTIVNYLGVGSNASYLEKAKWVAMGDSIVEGWYSYMNGSTPTAGVDETKGWAYKVSRLIGFDYTNIAIGGTGYLNKGPHALRNAKELADDTDFSNVGLVTLGYGVNDYKAGETLGTINDTPGVDSTVMANMRYVIEKILSDNPLCKIIVITPLNCVGYNFNYGSKATNYALGYQINGKTLQDFFEAFVAVCNYYGVEYIDMTHYSSVNRENLLELLLDGVHPSENEHTVLARELSKKILFY